MLQMCQTSEQAPYYAVIVSLIPQNEIDAAWPVAVKHLEPAILTSGGRYTLETVYNAIKAGDMQLWMVNEMASCVSHIGEYPTGQLWGSVKLMGGAEMALWFHPAMDAIEAWAAELGCVGMEPGGRPGLGMYLRERGYRDAHRSWVKELPHAR